MRGLALALTSLLALVGCVSPDTAPQAIDPSLVLEAPYLFVDFRNASIPQWMSVTVRNQDNDTWFVVKRDDFRIRDSTGAVFGHLPEGYYYAPEPFPVAQRLEPHERLRGTLVFSVNDGAPPYTLLYGWPEGRIEYPLVPGPQ